MINISKVIGDAVKSLFDEGLASRATRLNQACIAIERLIEADMEYDSSKLGMYLAEGKPVYLMAVKRFEDANMARKQALDDVVTEATLFRRNATRTTDRGGGGG